MSNPMRGEAALGDRQIVANFNSLCRAEAALGMKVPQILEAIATEGLGFEDVRRLIQSLLIGDKMTLDQVGDFIDSVGLDAAGEAIAKALLGFFPAAEEGDAAGPPKAE